jgi:hypothetical protein
MPPEVSSARWGRVNHFIECETLRGFHASAAGVTPAASDKKSRNVEDDLSLWFFWEWAAGIYLARYFTGEEAGGRSRR